MVLLVLDTQKGCFNESLYEFERVKKKHKRLNRSSKGKQC